MRLLDHLLQSAAAALYTLQLLSERAFHGTRSVETAMVSHHKPAGTSLTETLQFSKRK